MSKGWRHLQPFKSTGLLLMEELLPIQAGGTGQDVLKRLNVPFVSVVL